MFIKAKDVKEGMETPNGSIHSAEVETNGNIGITFTAHDYDCGEDDYFPCEYSPDELVEVV